jgi:hypothetical protein
MVACNLQIWTHSVHLRYDGSTLVVVVFVCSNAARVVFAHAAHWLTCAASVEMMMTGSGATPCELLSPRWRVGRVGGVGRLYGAGEEGRGLGVVVTSKLCRHTRMAKSSVLLRQNKT